jgi:CubicO group peptidase (beta-lactamase class C family)
MNLKVCLTGISATILLAAGVGKAQDIKPAQPIVPAPPAVTAAPISEPLPAAHTLDPQDVNAWLDGFMKPSLATGNIAGAVVVVVKDGRVLTQRGFGVSDVATQAPVDPAATLFRAGSVSKLFTWTAVMQQVEAGKLQLDADINSYLDFKIPPRDDRPITLRNLMTHTAGFEERVKYLFVPSVKDLRPLGDYLKSWVPERIFPPGKVPAYSNYGAALAGYIVQRVSGEPFDSYIARHIFQPLGMTSSTFDQPLPAASVANLSKSYQLASGRPHPFELISAWPAGSLSVTGADMAQFMIAHLNDGQLGSARILMPDTARLMHAAAFAATPPLPGMALGFYHEDRNGHDIIGHAGDTETFHSDLHLFLNDATGLFVSFNSLGADGGAHLARTLLFREFTDRYFSTARVVNIPTPASAESDAERVAGTYVSSRRSDTSFLRVIFLIGETKVEAIGKGILTVSDKQSPGGALEHWREVSAFVWQRVNGLERLSAVVKDGKVQALGFEGAPYEVFQPAAGAYAPWNRILLEASLAVLTVTVVLWPISALVRRHYGRAFKLIGASAMLYRLVRLVAVVDITLAAGWLVVFALFVKDITILNDSLDPWLRLLQLLGVLAFVGGAIGLLNLFQVWRDNSRSKWAKLTSAILAFAMLGMAWLVVALRLVTASLQY